MNERVEAKRVVMIPVRISEQLNAMSEAYAAKHCIPLEEARYIVAQKVVELGIRDFRKALEVARETTASLVDKYTTNGGER